MFIPPCQHLAQYWKYSFTQQIFSGTTNGPGTVPGEEQIQGQPTLFTPEETLR